MAALRKILLDNLKELSPVSVFTWNKKYRNIKRLRQIILVIVKYGLEYFFDRPSLERYLKIGKKIFWDKKISGKASKLSLPERARMVLEELGPTFIKLGQVLSTRPDLVPPEFSKEFSKLQDSAPPFSYMEVKGMVEREFGKPIKEVFSSFSQQPVAAASLSQVHKARLLDGQWVAVKVQRPGIREVISNDLAILSDLARFMEKRVVGSRLYQPVEVVGEFSRAIKKELDFIQEGHNLEKFRINFKESQAVRVPKVHWQLTTSQVLVMEFIDGKKISEVINIKTAAYNKKLLAKRGVEAVLKQIFEDGFFHADPHPGNIFVIKGNVIVLLDCGMVGFIDQETMNNMASLLVAVVSKDIAKIIAAFEDMDIIDEDMDIKRLKADIWEFIDRYYGVPLKRLQVGKIGEDILEVVIRHGIKVPANLVLLIKALVTAENIGRQLDPDLDMVGYLRPFVRNLIKKAYSPMQVWKKSSSFLVDSAKLLWFLPAEFKWLIKKLKKGELNIGFQHKGLEKMMLTIDKASNRFSLSIIIAALIVGSSLIIQSGKGPLLFDFPILGVLGFLAAAVFGIGLIISILRSGKF